MAVGAAAGFLGVAACCWVLLLLLVMSVIVLLFSVMVSLQFFHKPESGRGWRGTPSLEGDSPNDDCTSSSLPRCKIKSLRESGDESGEEREVEKSKSEYILVLISPTNLRGEGSLMQLQIQLSHPSAQRGG